MYYNGQYGGQFPPPPPQYYQPPADFVTYEEKRKIRRNYNSIGITLLTLVVLMEVICTVAAQLLQNFGNELVYNEDGVRIVNFWDIIVGSCFPALIAMLVFAGYCLITRFNAAELFGTEKLRGKELLGYVFAVLFMQQVSMICSIVMMTVLDGLNLYVPNVSYVLDHTPEAYLADLLSAVVLAPIAEELIYRGVVLRCAAKVSGRFAIFFSAFIFGIMHGNPYQFVLGFLIGIPLAMVTLKTGSLIPAIICHMANNLVASVSVIAEYFNEDIANVISWICMPVFFIAGLAVIIASAANGRIRLPAYTDYHRRRTLPIMITSWSIVLMTVIYVLLLILSISVKM